MGVNLTVSEDQALKEIEVCKKKILEHQQTIADIFVELGHAKTASDVVLTIGPEIEMTEVAGRKAWKARTRDITKQINSGQVDINSKFDGYMPKAAQAETLAARYQPHPLMKDNIRDRHVKVELEPRAKGNIALEQYVVKPKKNHEMHISPVAYSQIEFTLFPMNPLQVVRWICHIMDNAVNRAHEIGLKRIDTRAVPDQQTSPNSVHLNCVIGIKKGEDKRGHPILKNAFSHKEWTGKGDVKTPSHLALCIGEKHKEFLSHSLFLFARAESD